LAEPEGITWHQNWPIPIFSTPFLAKVVEKNAENLLVIQDGSLASKYLMNWQEHERHSEPYYGR